MLGSKAVAESLFVLCRILKNPAISRFGRVAEWFKAPVLKYAGRGRD
jgi:hypothetical protein